MGQGRCSDPGVGTGLTTTTASPTLRVGTRQSALARAQTDWVVAALRQAQPSLSFEVRFIVTEGDRTQGTNAPGPSWGTGVFVKELETALLRGEIDLAVHSLKDLPPAMTEGLAIAAIPAREDPRDLLVTRECATLAEIPCGARIGTTSTRRIAFLKAVRPDLQFVPLRGNVDTRLRKLQAGQCDALVLAAAGLRRLKLNARTAPLDLSELLPAPGQGALAIEARADDPAALEAVTSLHDSATAAAVQAERTLMASLGGACRSPIGALGVPGSDGSLTLHAAVAAPDGSKVLSTTRHGLATSPDLLAQDAVAALRALGADELLASSHAA